MYYGILDHVGRTPLIKLDSTGIADVGLYSKLEYYNPTGSVKDRAASYIIKKLLENKEIDRDTVLIESSSGNFGIALSAYCKSYGLKFCCVVDPHITPVNKMLIETLSTDMIMVDKPDTSGGYLKTRIEKVKQLRSEIPNSYWTNQYGNPYIVEAYYNTLGTEICDGMSRLDYIFIGVSSGGTITGVSHKVKEKHPHAKVIAVDSVGSVIFGGQPEKRFIPGMGSSMVPDVLQNARIDEVVMMEECEAISMCHKLLANQLIFAGGSSGSVLGAVKKYFQRRSFKCRPNVAVIFADRGDRYAGTIYNNEWLENTFALNHVQLEKQILFAGGNR